MTPKRNNRNFMLPQRDSWQKNQRQSTSHRSPSLPWIFVKDVRISIAKVRFAAPKWLFHNVLQVLTKPIPNQNRAFWQRDHKTYNRFLSWISYFLNHLVIDCYVLLWDFSLRYLYRVSISYMFNKTILRLRYNILSTQKVPLLTKS